MFVKALEAFALGAGLYQAGVAAAGLIKMIILFTFFTPIGGVTNFILFFLFLPVVLQSSFLMSFLVLLGYIYFYAST